MAVKRLEILLDRLHRCPGGAGRAIEAGADDPANAQRRGIDGQRPRRERQISAPAHHGEIEIEARAEGNAFERTRGTSGYAAAQHTVDAGAAA